MRRFAPLIAVFATVLGLAQASDARAARAATRAQPVVYQGYGFDACTAPSLSALSAWTASPYRALGIYVGGANRACASGNLSASWVASAVASGWSLLPLYVGLQAPCVGQAGLKKIGAALATVQGADAASDAVARAAGLGLLPGTPIYFDMEAYKTNDPLCSLVVEDFIAAWVIGLHASGYVAGVYGSAASTIRDVALLPPGETADAVWIANWNGKQSVFGDPYVSDSLWPNHQRLHQYRGGHQETYGGVTINIDSSIVDAPVAGPGGIGPASPPPTTPTPSPSPSPHPGPNPDRGNGQHARRRRDGHLARERVRYRGDRDPHHDDAPEEDAGVRGRQLHRTAERADHIGYAGGAVRRPAGDAFRAARARPRPRLLGRRNQLDASRPLHRHGLPTGVDNRFRQAPDGSIDITTVVPGSFGLLLDTARPSRPTVTARLNRGALQLHWQPATDNSSTIAGYQITFGGKPVLTLAGTATHASLTSFHTNTISVFRVRAADSAANQSDASKAIVITPKVKPRISADVIPRWAWQLATWQSAGKRGVRPKTPSPVPPWYWTWVDWRLHPYGIKS